MPAGTLELGGIPQLPDSWWTRPDDESVWTTWDRDTYYLWGANAGNYAFAERGALIGGGGMAGPNGPTRGRQHEHYVGVNTMSDDAAVTRAVFDRLDELLARGKRVLVPTWRGRYSLGTGIAAEQPGWAAIQLHVLERVLALAEAAERFVAPPGTFWPDCRVRTPARGGGAPCSVCSPDAAVPLDVHSTAAHPLGSRQDLEAVLRALAS